MVKVLVLCPNPVDATSWYRAWGVFKNIRKQASFEFISMEDAKISMQVLGPDKKPMMGKVIAWPLIEAYDVLFIQRGFGIDLVNIVESLAYGRIKIIYDLDDNLWEIPPSYGVKKHYPPQILKSMENLMKMSDQVWVSTKALGDYIREKVGITCKVVPNGVDFSQSPIVENFNFKGVNLWRGSSTHVDDLRRFKPEMEAVKDLVFFGYDPVKEEPKLKAGRYIPIDPVDSSKYFATIKYLAPKRVFVPLDETPFNAAKSNIAWLEATMAGGVVFSNQWGEFEGKGFKFVDNPTDEEMAAEWAKSAEIAREQYDLSTINQLRIKLINEL